MDDNYAMISFNPQDPAHLEAAARLWTAACGPDLAISPNFVRLNTRPVEGVVQSGRLALLDDQPVGFILASATVSGPVWLLHAAWIDALAVDPAVQGRGLGTALMDWAEAWVREQGADRLRLGAGLRPFTPGLPVEMPAAERSRRFFTRRGFAQRPTESFEWDVAHDLAQYVPPDLPPTEAQLLPVRSGQEADLLAFLEREFPERWHFEARQNLIDGLRLSDTLLLWTPEGPQAFCQITFEDSLRPIERFYMHRLPRPWGQLGPLGVARGARGRGYGAVLIDGALRHLRQHGVRGCVIDWTDLLELYGKFGFRPFRKYEMLRKSLVETQNLASPQDIASLQPDPQQIAPPPIANLLTESLNPATAEIDQLSTQEMLQLINAEDAKVAPAVAAELPQIAAAVDAIAARMQQGGRLIYIGAGTSGRIGILDASECPPTFSTAPGQIVGVIAGGEYAITHAVEGAEDDAGAGRQAIIELNVTEKDSLVGIAASGSTRYVVAGMQEARERGALVISLACNRPSQIESLAHISIAPIVGPEVIAGSTRMKAGTAQKLVLNMISTGVMVRLGKTFGNLMVDVRPTNAKLRLRARRIVAEACGLSEAEATAALEAADGEVKTAIVAVLAGVSPQAARQRLEASGGSVRRALEGV